MSRTLHSRLKPIVIGIIEAFSPDIAADMILKLALNPEIQNAPPPDVAKAKSATNGAATGTAGRRGGRPPIMMKAPPVLEEPIDPEREYIVLDTANLLGLTEGTFRAWYVKPECPMKVTRTPLGNGQTRVTFKGSEIIRIREMRESAAANQQQH